MLNIIIVGAGIAGLAVSIGLARHGHKVIVLERRESNTSSEEGGAGIQLQPNVSSILERWGMLEDIRRIAHDNEMSDLRVVECRETGEMKATSVVKMDFKNRGFAWYSSRQAFREVFRHTATKLGVEIKQGCKVVDIRFERPSIVLENGAVLEADLIVGADGSGSRVRKKLFPGYKAQITDKASFHVVLPIPVVEGDAQLKTLLDGVHNVITLAPERFVFISPFPHGNIVDFQLADYEYSQEIASSDLISERINDLTWLKARFDEFGPALRKALDLAESAFKWRMVEVTGLPCWSSKTANVVLLGDSAHGMLPFAGQGSAMGIEDAVALSELLAQSSSGDDLRPLLKLYEQIRRPRCLKAQKLARVMGATWAIKDPKQIRARNERWKSMNDPSYLSAKPDESAQYGSPAFQKWLDKYDIFEAVEAALSRSEVASAKL